MGGGVEDFVTTCQQVRCLSEAMRLEVLLPCELILLDMIEKNNIILNFHAPRCRRVRAFVHLNELLLHARDMMDDFCRR